MRIMTGKTGTPHVTSQQFRQLVEGTVGQGSYILTSGENLEPELQTNNSLKIRSGMMSHHGNLSVVELGTYDEVTIQNGTQGMQRIDLVVNRYTRNEETGIEDNEWFVIMGTPAASDPVAPAYTEGNLQVGDLVDDCPVFEVHLDGINVTEVVKLLDVTSDMSTLNASLSYLAKITEGEITPYTDRETVYGSSLKRQGNMVELLLNVGTTASIAVGHRLADIPAEYAPSEGIIVSATYYGNTYAVSINSNGTVTNISSGAIPAGETLRIHETYFINS